MAPERRLPVGARAHVDTAISLKGLDYTKARAIPGAIYSSEHKGIILPVVTPRAAIVALALFPGLGADYPELIEARESLMADVRPTDYATPLGIEIDAPYVHQTLLEDGHDWLEFDDGRVHGELPTQSTDLGYAAAILRKHGAFYLGWARGKGKTLGTAAIIEANGYKSVLIAVPNTAKQDVWLRELRKRNERHELIVLGNTPAARERALAKADDFDAAGVPFILVVHHESLALIAGTKPRPSGKGKTVLDGWKKLGIKWDLMAFDEAHRLKSAGRNGSLLHRAALKVPAEHRLALGGSFFENNWEEPYGPLHWLYPNRYSTRDDWDGRFLDYADGGYGRVLVGVQQGKEQDMRDELGVFLIIREKDDLSVANTVEVELSPGQLVAYHELQNDFVTQLEDGTAVLAQSGVVMLTRLRQVATGLDTLGKVSDSSKIDAATQLIRDNRDDDFFVACWYKASAYALAERLRGMAAVSVITGDVPQNKRSEIIEATRAVVGTINEPVVLIGTIPTLGESANLQHLNHVVRLDRSFNPALNRQVVDRCDRTGQERQVYLTDIVAKDTVDELVVMPNLANKDAFRALILGRGA